MCEKNHERCEYLIMVFRSRKSKKSIWSLISENVPGGGWAGNPPWNRAKTVIFDGFQFG